MRLSLSHPSDSTLKAIAGWDASALGWWCEVRRSGQLVGSVDALVTGETTLEEVLRLLESWRFWTIEERSEALSLLPHMASTDMPSRPGKVAQIISVLKQAAE